MEILTILLFCGALLTCVFFKISILYALVAGLIIFTTYGLRRGFSLSEILKMCLSGINTSRKVLLMLVLIGIMTALWRAAGTVPVIISYASSLIRPSIFILITFWLNCLVAVLMGTAFGTAATMGLICATLARTMEISPVLLGAAVLSGVYFGDRCSPVSTSALLVAELTGTNIYKNIKNMLKTALVPFLLASLLFFIFGLYTPKGDGSLDLVAIFSQDFRLHRIALFPAICIIVMAAFRVKIILTLVGSIVASIPVCLIFQKVELLEMLRYTVIGFSAQSPQVAEMLDGGGIISMLRVIVIISISSAYSGIFHGTGLLTEIQHSINRLGSKISNYGAILVTSVVGGMVSCNQTLTIILTHQLVKELPAKPEEIAIDIEDSAVVTAPLIPWSIAGAVPLASVGAPTESILFSFFLYLLPLWRVATGLIRQSRSRSF